MSLSSRKETKPERGTRTRQQERVAEYITRLAREKQAGEPDWLIEHFVQQGLRVLELEQQKTEQARQIEAQAAEIVELKEKLAQAERAGKRQAAPSDGRSEKLSPNVPGEKPVIEVTGGNPRSERRRRTLRNASRDMPRLRSTLRQRASASHRANRH